MDMTTTGSKSPMLKAAEFDFNKEAGPMAGATSWSPSDNAMASSQLSKILASDSKLMTQARGNAARSSARRGLLNSSIGVEAGESAAIAAATPLAQSDANVWSASEQFNAQAGNDFNRDSNAFGRQGATEKFRGVLARESQDRDQAWRSGENVLDRNLTQSESAAGRQFQSGERTASQDFSAQQNQLERQQRESLQTQDQQFRVGENRLDREQQRALTMQGQEFQAKQQELSQKFQMDFERFRIPLNAQSGFMERMQTTIGNIMADPNLTPEAKDGAIQNYYNYANQTMSWMSTFYGQPMPNVRGGQNIVGGAPAPAAPAAPYPNPVSQPPAEVAEPTVGIPRGNPNWERPVVNEDGSYETPEGRFDRSGNPMFNR